MDNVNSNDTSAPTTQPDIRKDIETKRVGLVLCGGGFKGAYQIGVWKALREIGFQKFDVIAGSSVGALNAVLVANGDVEAAERVWQEINVMQWEPRSVGWYVSGYLLLFGPLIAFLVVLARSGLNELAWHFYGWSMYLMAESFFGSLYVTRLSPFYVLFYFVQPEILALMSGFGIFAQLSFLFAFPWLPKAVHIEQTQIVLSWLSSPDISVWQLLFLTCAPLGIVFGWLGIRNVTKGHRQAHLFSSAGIVRELEHSLNLQRMKANVASLFVTVAKGHTGYDPFMLNELNTLYPRMTTEWLPRYVNLCRLDSAKEATDVLRAFNKTLLSTTPFATKSFLLGPSSLALI